MLFVCVLRNVSARHFSFRLNTRRKICVTKRLLRKHPHITIWMSHAKSIGQRKWNSTPKTAK